MWSKVPFTIFFFLLLPSFPPRHWRQHRGPGSQSLSLPLFSPPQSLRTLRRFSSNSLLLFGQSTFAAAEPPGRPALLWLALAGLPFPLVLHSHSLLCLRGSYLYSIKESLVIERYVDIPLQQQQSIFFTKLVFSFSSLSLFTSSIVLESSNKIVQMLDYIVSNFSPLYPQRYFFFPNT